MKVSKRKVSSQILAKKKKIFFSKLKKIYIIKNLNNWNIFYQDFSTHTPYNPPFWGPHVSSNRLTRCLVNWKPPSLQYNQGARWFFFLTPTASLTHQPYPLPDWLVWTRGPSNPTRFGGRKASAAGLRDSRPSRRPQARMHVANMGLDLFSFQYYAHAHGRNSLTQHAWL